MQRGEKKRLGILGGTFDPIHCGHLILAEQLKEKLNLAQVIFVPSANPPHKENSYLSEAKERFKMVKLAIQGNPGFLISDLELKRKGKSYTIDTLTQFKKLYPDSELFLLAGSDVLDELQTWKEPDKIFELARVALALRPGFDRVEREDRFLKKSLLVSINGLDISSTQIREKVKDGKSIKYLVPSGVEKYIFARNLYQSR